MWGFSVLGDFAKCYSCFAVVGALLAATEGPTCWQHEQEGALEKWFQDWSPNQTALYFNKSWVSSPSILGGRSD